MRRDTHYGKGCGDAVEERVESFRTNRYLIAIANGSIWRKHLGGETASAIAQSLQLPKDLVRQQLVDALLLPSLREGFSLSCAEAMSVGIPVLRTRTAGTGEMVIENTRQLRHDADDSCPVGPDGKRQHTYDYKEGGCRQVRNVEVSANLGWANPSTGSAMVMRRG